MAHGKLKYNIGINMKIDNKLKDIIKDKKIAYVCPGSSLKDIGLGEKIDSYDVVIRVNQKFEIPEHVKKDYGSRTDILFGSFNICNIRECEKNWDWIKKQKYIVSTMVSDKSQVAFFDKLTEEKINNYIIPKEDIHNEVFLRAYKTIANSGLVGLQAVLECEPEKIFVSGMSFYNMGNYGKVYFDDYYDSVTKNGGQFIGNENKIMTPENGRSDLHNQKKQIVYFIDLMNKYPNKIELDPYLKENIPKFDYDKALKGVKEENQKVEKVKN